MSLAVLERGRTVAPAAYNRWLIPPAALAIHLCIGQAYATSVYKLSLVEHFDASITAVGVVFSIAIVMLGLSAAVFGTWVDSGGPRRAMVAAAAALCWSVGFLVGAAGIATGRLWLLYLGYGVKGGIGLRHRLHLTCVQPCPDQLVPRPARAGHRLGDHGLRRGALIASPVSSKLLGLYDEGFEPSDATAVASGSAVAQLFVTLGVVYLTVLFCNVTAGIGILEQASPMIQDFFRGDDGLSTVGPAVAAGFVGLLSICNVAGRFVWSTTSD